MSDELSEAEREAMEHARYDHFPRPRPRTVAADTIDVARWDAFDDGWRAARDYYTDPAYCASCASCGGPCRDESPDPLEQALQRERALREALTRLLNASRDIMPYEKKGPVNELIEAEAHADSVLVASPQSDAPQRQDSLAEHSSCCGGRVDVEGGREGTRFYRCADCGRPCDATPHGERS